jgi:large subunit ribosomal protein L5
MTARQKKKEERAPEALVEAPPRPRMKERYRQEIAPALMRRFGYRQVMEVPRVSKIVVSMGVGAATQDPKILESAMQDLAIIAGQRPCLRRAKRSIAQFRLREKNAVGCMVTLRGDRMYEFLDRLLNAALPRIRDFHGVPTKAFDGRGNFSLGVKEQLIFPEIDYDKVDRIRGMQINIITTARTDEEGRRLLEMMGMPFSKERV